LKSAKNDITFSAEEKKVRELLAEVYDPEVPVLSVLDLGIIRDVKIVPNETNASGNFEVFITVTPTYSGCPALDAINMSIRMKLLEHGFRNVNIRQVLSPAWTTDWITLEGKDKLKTYGIAPPNPRQQFCREEMFSEETVQCPRCNSYNTQMVSQFGSTACKSLYKCNDCMEPFDYFKCH
jgi:ring-1,2-phenylacetyl-CoA epoxidase subunit PaaD